MTCYSIVSTKIVSPSKQYSLELVTYFPLTVHCVLLKSCLYSAMIVSVSVSEGDHAPLCSNVYATEALVKEIV